MRQPQPRSNSPGAALAPAATAPRVDRPAIVIQTITKQDRDQDPQQTDRRDVEEEEEAGQQRLRKEGRWRARKDNCVATARSEA